MSQSPDRLYELLPAVYRQRDAEQGYPLQTLLRVISEQVDVVETDISQLYENWFIETCQDWVVPYIGDLIGYRLVHEAGEPGDVNTLQGLQRNKILIPRREVANTIRYRQRKGTLALLELLANDVAGWPSRVVEFYKLLGWAQHINHLRPLQGRTVDLRQGDTLDRLDGPFDEVAHTVDVRRITSPYDLGRYNIHHVGVFIWRLKPYSVTKTPAYCVEEVGPNCYTFSVLGNDTPLYTRPRPETDPTHIADELNLPIPIRRKAFEIHKNEYYGEYQSLQIWEGVPQQSSTSRQLIPLERIIPADLSDWQYRPPQGKVAIDPVLGRIVFPLRQLPKTGVWVSYHYGFSGDIGGGEYDRTLFQPVKHTLYRVGRQGDYPTINAALAKWQTDLQAGPYREEIHHAVVEIIDSGVYTERFNIILEQNQSLQIRAANHTRPVIRLLDYLTDAPDSLGVVVKPGSRLTLDGLLITGRGVHISQDVTESSTDVNSESSNNKPASSASVRVIIRHSTLVPGWTLDCDCEPKRPAEPSLELFDVNAMVSIEHSIIGSIQVNQDEVQTNPIPIQISDSILDATGTEREALDAPGYPVAHAQLTILRSTVFGQILVHSIALAENSIFDGIITAARRQQGCVRFCYITPGSRTPRRYNCQPDLVNQAAPDDLKQMERERVRPQFTSTRYGTPAYCQLADRCAQEIKQGADDESEMGVFHYLYQPQRAANLRSRLDEYIPAGMQVGIIYSN